MSDLAKKCAARLMNESLVDRVFDDNETSAKNKALAAFIEAAARVRETLVYKYPGTKSAEIYDAALRDLAQSMEVE